MNDDILSSLLKMIEEKDARIKELTDMLLKNTGVIEPDNFGADLTQNAGTNIGKSSNWQARRAMLENRFKSVRQERSEPEYGSENVEETIE